jgi:hypothetical protein
VARYAAGTQSVAAFCRGEAVSTWSFYKWRGRLRGLDASGVPARPAVPEPAPFIDLGAVAGPAGGTSAKAGAATAAPGNIAVRLDLGGGLVLTIVRH